MTAQAQISSPQTGSAICPEAVAAPVISFRCAPEDVGVIAPPRPAKQMVPDWYKRLPAVDPALQSVTSTGLTAKRCMPFLDALTIGWVIPLAATVRMEVSEGGTRVDCGWDFDREMVSNHAPGQVAGHPRQPRPPVKFHNYWTVATPPGWSCLFVSLLNQPHNLFEMASAVVDTDRYQSLIHFPFFPTAPDGLHVLEKGLPVIQVIPFRRDQSAYAMAAEIRAETPAEATEAERIRRATKAGEGWYREEARAPR
jgi:hypothetical protein